MTPLHRTLVTVAAVLGVGALAAGDPGGAGDARLLAELEQPIPTLGAVELAGWIRDRRPGLRVLDLRTRPEFDAFHVPGSRHATVGGLLEEDPTGLETLVLVGRGVGAAGAAPLLRAAGWSVVVLDGGIDGWIEGVLEPVLPAHADSALEARFREVEELSRYFGGAPRRAAPGEAVVTPWAVERTPSMEVLLEELRVRGGCGW